MRVLRAACMLLALLALTLSVPATTATGQQAQPQCADGVDNDVDNATDGADAGCADGADDDETDSPNAGIRIVTVPLPVVTLQGTVDAKGTVDLSRVQVRALRGSIADVRCSGAKCPFARVTRTMITSSLRLTRLERSLKAPMTITMRIARPHQLGKYLSYRIRRNQPPVRTDSCLDQTTQKVRPCFVG